MQAVVVVPLEVAGPVKRQPSTRKRVAVAAVKMPSAAPRVPVLITNSQFSNATSAPVTFTIAVIVLTLVTKTQLRMVTFAAVMFIEAAAAVL